VRRGRAALRPLAVLAALALTAAACAGGNGRPGAPAAPGTQRASGPPVVVGFVNQENAPGGSFPELRIGAQAAVRYVNEELGGAGGRPLQLATCATVGTPESSQACANQLLPRSPVAVIGGIDFGADTSLPIYERSAVPYVGGTPTVDAELTSGDAFMLVGGAPAELLGEASYLTDTLHARKISVLYVDLPGLLSSAAQIAGQILKKKGVTDARLVPEKADVADFTPAVTTANGGGPDAIAAVFPAQGCSRVMQARAALGVKAQMLYPGACLERPVLAAGGAGAEDAVFATGLLPYDAADPEVATYRAKMRQYGRSGADTSLSVLAQTGFALVVDVSRVLTEAARGGQLSPAAFTAQLKATRDHGGFMSHPFTCDGKQVSLVTAACNPWVRLLRYHGGRFQDLTGTWVSGADLVKLVG
jgi:branched-chain amino acid transport system substrate-binding protein